MYVKIIATGETTLTQQTRSSDNGWWYIHDNGLQYHESQLIVCCNKA